jgi:hypothetical protein
VKRTLLAVLQGSREEERAAAASRSSSPAQRIGGLRGDLACWVFCGGLGRRRASLAFWRMVWGRRRWSCGYGALRRGGDCAALVQNIGSGRTWNAESKSTHCEQSEAAHLFCEVPRLRGIFQVTSAALPNVAREANCFALPRASRSAIASWDEAPDHRFRVGPCRNARLRGVQRWRCRLSVRKRLRRRRLWRKRNRVSGKRPVFGAFFIAGGERNAAVPRRSELPPRTSAIITSRLRLVRAARALRVRPHVRRRFARRRSRWDP